MFFPVHSTGTAECHSELHDYEFHPCLEARIATPASDHPDHNRRPQTSSFPHPRSLAPTLRDIPNPPKYPVFGRLTLRSKGDGKVFLAPQSARLPAPRLGERERVGRGGEPDKGCA
jgi:hypothetical protein